jgi:hypothetical protein
MRVNGRHDSVGIPPERPSRAGSGLGSGVEPSPDSREPGADARPGLRLVVFLRSRAIGGPHDQDDREVERRTDRGYQFQRPEDRMAEPHAPGTRDPRCQPQVQEASMRRTRPVPTSPTTSTRHIGCRLPRPRCDALQRRAPRERPRQPTRRDPTTRGSRTPPRTLVARLPPMSPTARRAGDLLLPERLHWDGDLVEARRHSHPTLTRIGRCRTEGSGALALGGPEHPPEHAVARSRAVGQHRLHELSGPAGVLQRPAEVPALGRRLPAGQPQTAGELGRRKGRDRRVTMALA